MSSPGPLRLGIPALEARRWWGARLLVVCAVSFLIRGLDAFAHSRVPLRLRASHRAEQSRRTGKAVRGLASLSMHYRRGVRRAENVPGDLFVDETCINCDTCRWMAPGKKKREGVREGWGLEREKGRKRERGLKRVSAQGVGYEQ
jgi:hypothetical protein